MADPTRDPSRWGRVHLEADQRPFLPPAATEVDERATRIFYRVTLAWLIHGHRPTRTISLANALWEAVKLSASAIMIVLAVGGLAVIFGVGLGLVLMAVAPFVVEP